MSLFYRFANAPEAARMDWSSFTKGFFLNRETLVAVLLLVDASVPPQKIDLDCANWLGRNNVTQLLLSYFQTVLLFYYLIYNATLQSNVVMFYIFHPNLQIAMTLVFTKCDKMKGGKGKKPDENIKSFQELIVQNYKVHPPWIMTSSANGLGRDELLLHMSQLRNYWDN